MKKLTLSNGVTIRAYSGDGFDGSSGIYLSYDRKKDPEQVEGEWGYPIPHKDLPKVIKLVDWYIKEEMRRREWEGSIWRNTKDEYPALKDESNPYQLAFRLGHLKAHLHMIKPAKVEKARLHERTHARYNKMAK